MAKFLKRVTLVELSSPGVSTVLYKSKKKKRRVSGWLKPAERGDRRIAQATRVFGDELLNRQNRSNRKRKNGWLRDGNTNLMRASRKALKKLTRI